MMKFAGVSAATVLLKPSFAQSADDKPFTFALITDTHIGRTGELDVEHFKATINEINASPAEFTLHCGDLVDNGQDPNREHRYEQWMQLAGKFKNPWHAVPGNHDPIATFKKHIHPETEIAVDRDPYRFLLFADAKLNPAHDGAVSPAQIAWLDKELDKANSENRKVFLVAHIIYHKNEKPDRGWFIETGRDEFKNLLEKHHDNIVAFFTGHHHVGLRGWDDTFGIHEVVLPSNSWNSNEHLDKQSGYWDPDLRPAYTLATVTGSSIELHVKPVETPGNSPVKKLA
jgi:3',5'-cyclic AMP phosphodiesterase CpdA